MSSRDFILVEKQTTAVGLTPHCSPICLILPESAAVAAKGYRA
ncbi:MAG: hypothetical protein U0075_18170 [Thermomicrobiales bacterium]